MPDVLVYHEMNVWFKCKNIHPSVRKRLRRSLKPFWTTELQCLWNNLRKAGNSFCKSTGNQAKVAHAHFKTIQNTFDKTYRRDERRYNRARLVEIEEVVTKVPRRFWEMLGKIGSKKSLEIPMEVYDENGSIRSDINSVLGKWKTDYDNLYNGCTSDNYDKKFYEDSMRNLNNREANGYIISGLNHDITEDEVRRVIFNSKNRKATGIENLPN